MPQNRPVIVQSWKLCKSCGLFCSYNNYRIVRRSFDIFCVYHVVGTVGICACMDSAQTYAAGIHLRIRLSTLPIRILEISSLSYLLQSLSILYLYGPMGIVWHNCTWHVRGQERQRTHGSNLKATYNGRKTIATPRTSCACTRVQEHSHTTMDQMTRRIT